MPFKLKLKQTWSSPEAGGKAGDTFQVPEELREVTARQLVGCGAAEWDGDEPAPMETDSAGDGPRNRRSPKGRNSKAGAGDAQTDPGQAGSDSSAKPTAPTEDDPTGKPAKGK